MAVGDTSTFGIVTILSGLAASIMPNDTYGEAEAIIHNIHHSASARLEYYDAILDVSIVVDEHTGAGSWTGMFLHVNADIIYQLVNTSGASQYMGWNGVVTKMA
jgi:hypothetical protein